MSALDTARGQALAVATLALVPLLPFLGAAVSLDGPVFLAVSRQILAAPGDPYGFEMIWDPSSPYAAEFNLNPPLLSYYLAPWIALFGEREVVLHAALLPFPVLAALSFLGIARRAAGASVAPVALLVATPAFLVLATTLLLDVSALAFLLLAVYALLRGRDGSAGWAAVAGAAAAAAGLTKYVGMASAPLLAAGVLLLYPRRVRATALVLGIPLAIWGLWGAYTAHRYGTPHFLGGAALAGQRAFVPADFWNQTLSLPVYYGGALIFPVCVWARTLLRRKAGTEIAAAALVAGVAVLVFVLPEGFPPRRHALGTEEIALGAVFFAGAALVWALCLRPRRWLAGGLDAFLALWLTGFLIFSWFVNWHVNAADALLAAPPAILLLYRTPELRPSPRGAAVWAGVALALSLLLAWAEMEQAGVYRTVARRIATEIGDQPGQRWFFGNWGFQYYLEREHFQALAPKDYGPAYPQPTLQPGDWLATARNLTQMNVSHITATLRGREEASWSPGFRLPLRTNNPDAGAGFYSHHVGFLPWAWDTGPLEHIQLGRITVPPRGARRPTQSTDAQRGEAERGPGGASPATPR